MCKSTKCMFNNNNNNAKDEYTACNKNEVKYKIESTLRKLLVVDILLEKNLKNYYFIFNVHIRFDF